MCKFATWFSTESVIIKLNIVFIYDLSNMSPRSFVLYFLDGIAKVVLNHTILLQNLCISISNNDEYLGKEHNYISCSIFLIVLPRAFNSQYS